MLLFCYKYFSLFLIKVEINFKKVFSKLNKEIRDLRISNTNLFFSLLSFIVFLILICSGLLRLSSIFLVFSFFLLIKELKQVKLWIKKSRSDYIKLTLLYKTKYRYIYYFSNLIKIIFLIYTSYFCVWVLFLELTRFLKEIVSFEAYSDYIQKSFYHLYVLLVLFTHSALLDFAMESFIVYAHF